MGSEDGRILGRPAGREVNMYISEVEEVKDCFCYGIVHSGSVLGLHCVSFLVE